ncbi:hypothetical protein B566_EDAN009810 [Ephemera danica]|nr:hypothetical protein B566_EDAN009810 [Ephemera danica]
MPADYEMMVAASPPVFSHSPPASSFLATNYNYLRYGPAAFSPTRNNNNNNNTKKLSPEVFAKNPSKSLIANMAPRRPCLVVRGEDEACTQQPTTAIQPDIQLTKHKKKVCFADDRGLSLTQVRVMSEPSNCPPSWTREFLAQVTKGVNAEVAPEPWEVTFPQPASDYLEFRKRLDSENVSLENVIVKEADEVIVGTVKVRNISFHKEVFVRATFDGWETHEDAFCTFVPNNPICFGTSTSATAAGYVLYDTFSFRLTLKPRSRRVEFCVCFRVDGHEYWDNNNGKNYVLVKSTPPPVTKIPPTPNSNNNKNINENQKQQQRVHDALRAKMDSWSEFASWNHLVNDGPYW